MSSPRTRVALAVLLVILLAGVFGSGGYLITHEIRVHSTATTTTVAAAPVPSAVASATRAPHAPATSESPIASSIAVASVLGAALSDARLGGRVLVQVSDAETGATLLSRQGSTGAAPASTAKIATAIATLTVHAPTDRLTTRVLAGAAAGTIVLVGAGDPTLSAAPAGHASAYADAARIGDLAARVKASGVRTDRVVVDASLFAGPAVSPNWAAGDTPSDFASPITAAMVDGGRDTPQATIRSADPALAAGRALAAILGVPASAVTEGRAPAGAKVLGSVRSATVGELITQMLQASDNVIAECLARLVAVSRKATASFAGAAAAIRATIRGLGVDIGAGLTDGSGLSAADRLTPATLAALLRLAVSAAHPALHDVIAALPVAGWDGTLAERYHGSSAAGVVRAKTGTLTSVSALAGVIHDRDGRLLVFALIADRVGPTSADTDAAEAALDRVATALADCGCR